MKHINTKRIFTLFLALVMIFALVACAGMTNETSKEPETTDPSENTNPPALDTELPVRVSVLNGTTGFGMAKLMNDHKNGGAALNYEFKVETDASVINAGLIKGEIDIAALPTNAAATLYNKTEGAVSVLAINTLGVLYVVENGSTVKSLTDLEGKTVYAPAQNPAFIFEAICKASGVNVTIDTTYAQPAALMSAVAASEEGMLAVLPQPVLTVAMSKNENLTVALDLTSEWEKAVGSDSLVQGCIVVRNEFLNAHTAEVLKFMEEYKTSIEFVNANPAEAAEMVVALEIYTGAAPVAAKAIPSCNIVYIDGAAMKDALSAFLTTMFDFKAASVGGALPGDNFYFIPNA
ncbi:MAG: ABC transporter substrate-binding protein [Ruminococcaceae bacterium]|nr:ABC transporter substrate-binding protein [Oscillospiraceae bacterium]